MSNSKTIVVTGANAGIGKEVARQLAAGGHRVVAVCRNEAKAADAAKEIAAGAGSGQVEPFVGDLSSIASCRDFARRLASAYDRIDVLVNNAGVWMTRKEINADGLELTFMVNHVAPFMTTLLLADRLKASAPSRVVSVNAGLYVNGVADLDQLPAGKNFHPLKTYMHSKLCNILFSMELAKRLEGTGLTVNALHPGVIRTNLGVPRGPLGLVIRAVKLFWGTPESGAKPVVRLAIDSALDGVTGKYYDLFNETPLAPNALDRELSQRLWTYTAGLTGCDLPA